MEIQLNCNVDIIDVDDIIVSEDINSAVWKMLYVLIIFHCLYICICHCITLLSIRIYLRKWM